MAINEEERQLEVAREVEELTRTLAHSTREVPHPNDSYNMLGELGSIIDHVTQVCNQLAAWHRRVEDGTHYDGEEGGRLDSAHDVANDLTTAAGALRLASNHIHHAHARNGVIRWYDEPQHEKEA